MDKIILLTFNYLRKLGNLKEYVKKAESQQGNNRDKVILSLVRVLI